MHNRQLLGRTDLPLSKLVNKWQITSYYNSGSEFRCMGMDHEGSRLEEYTSRH